MSYERTPEIRARSSASQRARWADKTPYIEMFARFGKLVALDDARTKREKVLCICDCGTSKQVLGSALRRGMTQSCGCLTRRRGEESPNWRGGEEQERKLQKEWYSAQKQTERGRAWTLIHTAKGNAKRYNVPFELTVEDIIPFPAMCPVLGIPISLTDGERDTSPSLDRLVPEIGYIKSNVSIVSWRANAVKNYGTAEEHRAIADWIEQQLASARGKM